MAIALGYDPAMPPVIVGDKDAARLLTVKVSTLAVWRSTGRYDLPYQKVGRSIRYRVTDLAKFLNDRTRRHS